MTSSSSSASLSASPAPRSVHLPPQSQSHSPSPSPKNGSLDLPPPESKAYPPKKSPPLPWTDQQTLALIQAYQEKWYSLKKGQLKAFQWEEVSIAVADRCGLDEPSKTATQCRHKIEKLRKRYRSEMQKAYPNSWQFFELMDQMERGPNPMPLKARPITVAKSFPNNGSSNVSSYSHGYGSLYSCSTDYYNNDGGSDDSDENWNMTATARSKSKSINNIVRGDVRSVKGVAVERGFGGSGRAVRNPMNGKLGQYYDGGGSDDDSEEEEEERVVEEEEEEEEKGEEEGGGGMELAAEIRGFTEQFMGMESKKMEMMQETERYRKEMEKKRMAMIVEAQRKMVDTIGRAFGAHKRAKMAQES